MQSARPKFEALPLHHGDPPFSAWGLYGPQDELGTLNLLTDDVVLAAIQSIKSGQRIGLDLPLDFMARPPHGREAMQHAVQRKYPRLVHDEVISFNTQIGTQWDGFRHYGYQRENIFYNNVKVSDISGPGNPSKVGRDAWYQGPPITDKLGINKWCRSGIVGRGVLLDYLRWAEDNGRPYQLLGDHAIDVDDLDACAKAQGVQLKQGDILLIRAGWKVGYSTLTYDEKIAFSNSNPTVLVGLATSVKTLRWLWKHAFSACASDAPGLERWPTLPGEGEIGGIGRLRLHEVLLNGWGLPLGKLRSDFR